MLSLGVYPDVSLKAAGERRDELRAQLRDGVDPGQARKQERAAAVALTANALESVAREWHAKFAPQWSDTHAYKLIRRLEMHVFPFIGSKPVGELEPADVLPLLRKPEERGELETAHGIRVVIGQVCRYAMATGRASSDPTPALRDRKSVV